MKIAKLLEHRVFRLISLGRCPLPCSLNIHCTCGPAQNLLHLHAKKEANTRHVAVRKEKKIQFFRRRLRYLRVVKGEYRWGIVLAVLNNGNQGLLPNRPQLNALAVSHFNSSGRKRRFYAFVHRKSTRPIVVGQDVGTYGNHYVMRIK